MRQTSNHQPYDAAPTSYNIPVALVKPNWPRITQFGELVIRIHTERYALDGQTDYLATSYFDITL